MIHHFKKNIEKGVIEYSLYDPRYKEFWEHREVSINPAIAGQQVFTGNNRVAALMRARLIHWRGFGNENEIYIAFNEDELNEIFWEHDMELLNGAVIRSHTSVRDRELIAKEEQYNFRYGRKDLH